MTDRDPQERLIGIVGMRTLILALSTAVRIPAIGFLKIGKVLHLQSSRLAEGGHIGALN